MIDPESLILIEPDFSVQHENRITIHQKQPLLHVESLIDKTDERNLVIGFPVFKENPGRPQQPQYSIQEMLLYFENSSKCSYIKGVLDHQKKSFKQN